MKKKLLLIQPTPYDLRGRVIKKKRLYFVGLSLPIIAAMTPPDWDVEICLETIEEIPFDTDADVIGIGSMGHGVIRSLDIAKEFKSLGKTVIMGGYMVRLMPEESKKYCDAVVIGDVEEVWKELLEDFQAGSLKPFYKKEMKELSSPLPRYDLLINKNIGDFLPVQAGRGCPNSCSFCSVHCLYRGSYFQRDLKEVARDLKYVKALGFNKLLLLDDNIYSDPKYLEEICSKLKDLNMQWMSQCSIEIGRNKRLLKVLADSGCIALSFGLESISKVSLVGMNKSWANPDEYEILIKNIREAGIDVSTEMVAGADGDTVESLMATADFIEKNKIVVPRLYILTPIPGTDFYRDMMAQNRIINHNIYSYNGTEAVHIPKNMTPEELTETYWRLYNKIFSVKSILNRTLFRRDFLKRPLRFLFYLGVNLFYREQIRNKIPPNII